MKTMDRLFKRYADPFSLLNGYIQTGRFCEFIKSFHVNVEEDLQWEVYLHKVWDKSFIDFRDNLQATQDLQGMSEQEMEATVLESQRILANFNPTMGEGEQNNGSI